MVAEVEKLLKTLRPSALIVIGLTVLCYLVLVAKVNRLDVRKPGARSVGLFVGLGFGSSVHLGAAWVRTVFYVSTLMLARSAQFVHYLLLALLTVLACGFSRSWRAPLLELVSGVIMTAGLWVGGSLLAYLQQIRHDRGILIAYWLLAAFLSLCAVAVFVKEITFISEERKYFDENGETE